MISSALRCNVVVATVKMMTDGSDTFNWTPLMINRVDSSFYWGYILTQIPGGFLAAKFPANKLFGAAIFLSSCLNLLLPTATKLDWSLVFIVRFLQGLVEGITYPCMVGILRWWAPPQERSKLMTLSLMGPHAGVMVGFPVSGLLGDWVGWYAPYYVFGLLGIVWYCFWSWLSFEKPSEHPSISPREQSYIEESQDISASPTPNVLGLSWWKMLISLPVIAIIVASSASSWTFHLSMISQPKYFKEKFGIDSVSESILYSVLPSLVRMMFVPIGGHLADLVRNKKKMTTTRVRKLFTCIGFGLESVFLLAMVLSKSWIPAFIALILSVLSSSFTISGFMVNHLDLAPRYASIITGITNTGAALAGLVCPLVTQMITEIAPYNLHQMSQNWKYVIGIALGIHCNAIIFYAIFASGELQKWAVESSLETGKQDTQQINLKNKNEKL